VTWARRTLHLALRASLPLSSAFDVDQPIPLVSSLSLPPSLAAPSCRLLGHGLCSCLQSVPRRLQGLGRKRLRYIRSDGYAVTLGKCRALVAFHRLWSGSRCRRRVCCRSWDRDEGKGSGRNNRVAHVARA